MQQSPIGSGKDPTPALIFQWLSTKNERLRKNWLSSRCSRPYPRRWR